MTKHIYILLAFALGLFSVSCQGKKVEPAKSVAVADDKEAVNIPIFDAEKAYKNVEKQVSFGPRVPNTAEHRACRDYFVDYFKSLDAKVYTQDFDLPSYDGTLLKATNIIASFQPEKKKRIALFAHWDSRPWADRDPDKKKHYTPILGANDGASGVGVLMEVGRLLREQPTEVGVDIILLDAEDYGTHANYDGVHEETSWALGAQAWARTPHVDGYHARWGILLDMVGGKNAEFRFEASSERANRKLNRKIWNTARKLGYSQYFIEKQGGEVTDDHTFINRYGSVPTVDIIPYNFFDNWHTVKDDMSSIDVNTLKAVGQTIITVIYNER